MSAPGSNLADAKELLREMVAEAQELKSAAGGSVTDAVAGWLAPQYLLAAHAKLAATAGAERFEVLRTFMQDWAMLRRGDLSAARLQLDREELDWQRANSQSQKEQEFRECLPELTGGLNPETLARIERELRLL